eukprot:scaffold83446_cov24-Phaeocystis_antarctica.AAC.1
MHVEPRLPQPAATAAAPATHRVAQRGAVRARALVPLRHSGGAPAAQQQAEGVATPAAVHERSGVT